MNRIFLGGFVLIAAGAAVFGFGARNTLAHETTGPVLVPLIGITSVPDPLALPGGAGDVTYHYAVKNFLKEVPLSDVQITDDTCASISFVEGDGNHDGKLDFDETWRFVCTTKLSVTTKSTATVSGSAQDVTATHRAYATVVVGSTILPPLVSIVNITKVAYPLSLPAQGGAITFTYKVSNPGIVPLNNVTVTDDGCSAMSGKLGDTNGNDLLDVTEVWVYTCTKNLTETTVSQATVRAFSGGLQAVDDVSLTVTVDTPVPDFPQSGSLSPDKFTVWGILAGILAVLIILLVLARSGKLGRRFRKG